MRWIGILLAGFALGGCATNLPEPIREPPKDNVSIAAARQQPERYEGRQVRWGGSIAEVINRADSSCLAVVARPLEDSGRPRTVGRSPGRFLACTDRFLDPMVYERERLVTVAGTLQGVEARPVGEYPYRYPVVRIQALHLWEPEPERERHYYHRYDPYWYHPWGPWPYYRYPWFRPGPPYYW